MIDDSPKLKNIYTYILPTQKIKSPTQLN